MDEIYREVFRKCSIYLVENIQYEDLSDHLIQREALPKDIAEDINSIAHRRKKVEKLIDVLPRRSNETFSTFLECLRKTDQQHIAKIMMDTLNEMRRMRPPEEQCIDTNETEIIRASIACSEQIEMEHHPPCPSEESGSSYYNYYEMNSNPRGFVLIINNETFAKPLDDRMGSSKDANDLHSLFCKFGFSCDIKHNLTVDEMEQCLSAFSKLDDHAKVSCCVVILMSHGEEDHIYGSRCQHVSINELIAYFNDHKCPNLKDKPKLFIIQACRNYINPSTAGGSLVKKPPMTRLLSLDLSSDAVPNSANNSHSRADMLLAYSTAIGNKSVRCPASGSFFIQILIEVFQEKAYSTSVTDMLIEVNGKLREKNEDLEQISAPEVVLTKKWYLNPVK